MTLKVPLNDLSAITMPDKGGDARHAYLITTAAEISKTPRHFFKSMPREGICFECKRSPVTSGHRGRLAYRQNPAGWPTAFWSVGSLMMSFSSVYQDNKKEGKMVTFVFAAVTSGRRRNADAANQVKTVTQMKATHAHVHRKAFPYTAE